MIRTKNDKTKPTEIIINYYHCLVWLNEATLFTVNGDKTWGGKHNKSIQRGKFIYYYLFIFNILVVLFMRYLLYLWETHISYMGKTQLEF